ncbi:MAG: F0F1 ATP synthase subunit B [Planctomycetes bacterium]|jgi:F-type H+-transporting ATPase subunit b|nr:F0F1 ATP synthase subunit B [Planctomycetota bacterium]
MAEPLFSIRKALLLAAPVLLLASPSLASEGFDFGNMGQGLAAMVIFLVLLAVLGHWAWKPLVAQLRRREEAIARQIDDAKRQNQEAQELLEQYRRRMEQAEADAKELVAKTHQEAVTARELLLTKSREEAKENADAMKQDIERARQDAMKDLHGATTRLATEMAAKILEQTLGEDEQRRMVQRALEEMARERPEA